MVSDDQSSREVAVDLLFSREIKEELCSNIWEVSAGPRPCLGLYVQEHTVQHKPAENVIFFFDSIGQSNIVNAVLQAVHGFIGKGVRSEVNLDIGVL